MIITTNALLDKLNTFRVKDQAHKLISIESSEEIQTLYKTEAIVPENTFILGGGSNVLFTKFFEGLIIHSKITDIHIEEETKSEIIIKCGSGINWDWFVDYCVERNWGGIENLSDIPGNIGASPVQNIGAYGVEAKDCIVKVEAIDYTNGKKHILTNSECEFGYRDSIFKRKPHLFVSYVWYRLSKQPVINTKYGAIENEMESFEEKNIQNLRKAIIKIRRSKLPSVDDIGSAGSFFKNPVVDKSISTSLLEKKPDMPAYDVGDNHVKLSAAWLIDNTGLKGLRKGDVGTYPTQPLVIVNYGEAKGQEIASFSEYIQEEVNKKFGILLSPEVIFK